MATFPDGEGTLWDNVEWVEIKILGKRAGWVPVDIAIAFRNGAMDYDELKTHLTERPPHTATKVSDIIAAERRLN